MTAPALTLSGHLHDQDEIIFSNYEPRQASTLPPSFFNCKPDGLKTIDRVLYQSALSRLGKCMMLGTYSKPYFSLWLYVLMSLESSIGRSARTGVVSHPKL